MPYHRIPLLLATLLVLAACAGRDAATLRESRASEEARATASAAASAAARKASIPAPPPPAAPVVAASPAPAALVDSAASEGERLAVERRLPAPPPLQTPQSGTLTAGDYDDLLNPTLYARYAERYLQQGNAPDLPFIDTRQAIRIRVNDARGKPVPFAQVEAGATSLSTAADGSAVFFPALDKLPAQALDIRVRSESQPTLQRQIPLATLPADRTITLEVATPATTTVQALDLLLVLDTTGSMADELRYLQSELDAIVTGLRQRHANLDIRLGLIVYRDTGDDYVVRSFPFKQDIATTRKALAAQQANGGGDYPEAVDQALQEATRFDWRKQAAKALVFVADAPPHKDRMRASWNATAQLRRQGVHIVPVAASGVGDEAQYLMRSMAAATQSRYLFLTDDSGVGLAHQDPDVPCYVVTRLDGLLQRVLDGLVSGHRVEPAPEQVLRRVGDYDRGICLPASRKR